MRIACLLILVASLSACGLRNADTKVSKWLSTKGERERMKLELVILTDKLAPGATFENRDSVAFLDYYKERAAIHELAGYYINDTACFFQLYRKTPGLFKDKIAIGGYIKTSPLGQISMIKEVYITPNLKPEELEVKTNALFMTLIETGKVDKFENDHSYVMFPDKTNKYSIEQQRWVYIPAN